MCGRYSLTTAVAALEKLRFSGPPLNLASRWNIAPTQEAPVLRLRDGARRLDMLRWGLVPYWAEDASGGSRMINARGETVAEKPAFKAAYKARRCLVPADGFYDWAETGDDKRPWLFRLKEGAPFAFAGLWEKWVPDTGAMLETFTIVNCASAGNMTQYHSRTPVVLAEADYETWLDPSADPAALIKSPPDGLFEVTRVTTYVNKPANDDPHCFDPAPDGPEPVKAEPEPKKKKSKPVDDRQASLF